MKQTLSFLFLLIFLSTLFCSELIAANRTALVIGNSEYKSITALNNPVNDATDMKTTLEKLGFDVILRTNANRTTIRKAVRLFGNKIKKGGVGLFFYAGHGVQVDGVNYIIPVGVNIKMKYDVEDQALKMRYVLGAMEEANNNLNIIILDACRNNPFRGFRGGSQGLARMDAPTGSIIVYATAPGKQAADGQGRNGTYTAQLLKNLGTPNLSVQQMLNKTGLEVMRATSNEQVPWISSTPVEDYYLAMRPQPAYKPNTVSSQSIDLPQETSTSFDDILKAEETKKKAKQKWSEWQSNRESDYQKVKRIETSDNLTSKQKKEAWYRFLVAIAQDNPYSTTDNSMRERAESRIDFWTNINALPSKASKKNKTESYEKLQNSKIVFVSRVGENKEIFISDFEGKNISQITHHKSISLSPSLSQDGHWLTYTSYVNGKPDIFVQNMKTHIITTIAYKGMNITPGWVPGKFELVAALSLDGDQEVYLLSGKGEILKRLTRSGGIDVAPRVSPDGRKLAFVSRREGSPQIYVKNLDTDGVMRVSLQGKYNTSPAWSPSGDKLAYVGIVKNKIDIYVTGFDGAAPMQLTRDQGDNEDPSWSPDGSFIVFSSTREGASKIYVMTARGSEPRRLINLPGAQTDPQWSPGRGGISNNLSMNED